MSVWSIRGKIILSYLFAGPTTSPKGADMALSLKPTEAQNVRQNNKFPKVAASSLGSLWSSRLDSFLPVAAQFSNVLRNFDVHSILYTFVILNLNLSILIIYSR